MGNQQGKLQRHHQHHPQIGTIKKSVHWKTAECPSAPGRPALLALPDQPPDVICLRWERPKLDGGSPITGYTVEHRRVGSPHWVRATPMPTLRCEICISGLEPGWRYQFRVFAENVVGRSEPSDLSDILTVTLQRNAICAPRFLAELQNFNAVEDERVEFRIRFMGHPPPEINWFKDGYEIFSSRRTKIVSDNESSVLIIHQVALTDEGEIKCTATNRAGHVVTKAHLLVQAPPKIRLPRTYEDGLIVEAEETLRLKVGIAGQPPPMVTWLHDSVIIINGGRFEIINSERNSMLKIDNAQRDDRGEYSVKVSNTLGEDIASFLVTITSRPNPPGKVRLNMSFGKSATLSWAAPIDDGGCKIGNYILEYFRVGWNVWLKAATTRSLNTTLHDLIEGSEYKFRVKAENPYGVSDPSDESDILFIPDPKRGIIKPKSAELKLNGEKKPLSPRRKTVSPPARSVADAATETSALRYSPKSTRKYKPQLLDTDDLHREMSYGTSDVVLKQDIRKSPSPYLNHKQQTQKLEEKPSLLKPSTQPQTSLFSSTPSQLLNIPASVQIKEEKVKEESVREMMKISLDTVKKENKSSNNEKEKTQNSFQFIATNQNKKPFVFQNLSTIKDMSSGGINNSQKTPLESAEPKNSKWHNDPNNLKLSKLLCLPSKEDITNTPALERSSEPFQMNLNEQGNNFPNKTLNSMRNLPNLSIAIATGKLGDTATINTVKEQGQATESTREREWNAYHVSPSIVVAAPTLEATTTTIFPESSSPTPTLNNIPLATTSKITPTLIISNQTDHHEEIHTSNEFMVVVFDKNSRVKDKDKQDSFELDLEDAIQSPPISMSAPDLALLEYTSLHTNFPIRRSVSSTELLYERAMARFYEAVELEEAEKARKLKLAQDKLHPSTVRKRLGSMSETERLSFEKRSELRRQSADIPRPTIKKWTSKENITETRILSRTTAMNLSNTEKYSFESQEEEFLEDNYTTEDSNKPREDSFELGSDYTESTASSDEDSIERFKMELEARTSSPPSRELETYHPRNMSAGVFTPYRSPTSDEAAIILTKPVPLPSPDFIPKPILKKPSSKESVTSPASSDTEVPTINSAKATNQSSSEKLDITKSIKSFFKRDPNSQRSPTPTRNAKHTEESEVKNSNSLEKSNADLLLIEAAKKRQAKEEEERRKRLEAERIMKEEAQAAADHYSDLVQHVSTKKKYHTPIYKEQKELESVGMETSTKDERKEEETKQDKKEIHLKTNDSISAKSKISLAEKPQLTTTSAATSMASLMAVKLMKPPSENLTIQQQKVEEKIVVPTLKSQEVTDENDTAEITSTIVSETVEERPDSRGRPRLVKVKKIMKKRVPSNTRSRETSSSRPPPSSSSRDNSVCMQPLIDLSLTGSKHCLTMELKSLDAFEMQSSSDVKQEKQVNATMDVVDEKSLEQLTEEAHENVRSALNYSTDFILFIVACYVYLFKDAKLVLPILGLMIYRQLGEALTHCIPHWLRRRKP